MNHWAFRKLTPERQIWNGMMARCFNPKSTVYPGYGGRGITVCVRWLRYEFFLFDMGLRPPGMSLDRIDNNGSYSPKNCRWSSHKEQNNNRRITRFIKWNGQRKSIAQWSDELGIHQATITGRLNRGLSLDLVLSVGNLPKGRKGTEHRGSKIKPMAVRCIRRTKGILSNGYWANLYGVNCSVIHCIRSGKAWSHVTD